MRKKTENETKILLAIQITRKLKAVKQQTIASSLGMKQGNYSLIENGKIPLTIAQLEIICLELRIGLNELLALATRLEV